jgi:hypothetical protein
MTTRSKYPRRRENTRRAKEGRTKSTLIDSFLISPNIEQINECHLASPPLVLSFDENQSISAFNDSQSINSREWLSG